MNKKQVEDDKLTENLADNNKFNGSDLKQNSSDMDTGPSPDTQETQETQENHAVLGSQNTQRQAAIESLMHKDLLDGDANYIVVGKFGRTHGLDGKLFVHSYTDPIENLFTYSPVFLGDKTSISFLSHQKHGKNIVCQTEGIVDCDTARRLTNQLIYLHTDQLEELPSGQYYWHQLAGCSVVSDTGGHCFGVVDYLYAGAQFPIMVIKDPTSDKKTEHLIPYEPSTVKAVDIDKRQIMVDWLID